MPTPVKVSLPVETGGRATITLNWISDGGTTSDEYWLRILREAPGEPTVALLGVPKVFQNHVYPDCKSWTWVDDNIPFTKTATYKVQVQRKQGAPYLRELTLFAQHFKR